MTDPRPVHVPHAGPIRRDPVDLDTAVELMPAWASPAYVAGLTGDPPYVRRDPVRPMWECDDPGCAVKYDDGPTCWACGGQGSTEVDRLAKTRSQRRRGAA